MTTLTVVSLALNAAAFVVLIVQRVRHERFAATSCSTCPFVVGHAAAPERVPLPTYDEPTTMFRAH